MRAIFTLMLVMVLASGSFAAISVKGGLAGGAARVALAADLKQINDKFGISGDIGYGFGQYTLVTAGLSGTYKIKDDMYAGLAVEYSSYSTAVTLGFPSINITDKSGVGFGVFAGMTRDKMYVQAGYDTRLGAIAEAGYVIRM